MIRIARFVSAHPRRSWGLTLLAAGAVAAACGVLSLHVSQEWRRSQLQTEAGRLSVEVMSQTLNGNLMGSVAVLGMIEEDIRREARGALAPNGSRVLPMLENIGRSYGAHGVFVVDDKAAVASSWDSSGKRSTGINVQFRPYYKMAKQGRSNVYAAVSLARGDRALYFSAPVVSQDGGVAVSIGAVVARTSLAAVDNLLIDKSDIVLLLSPQGVVFASNRQELIGQLAGTPSKERLQAIRDLKQFGNMFEAVEPKLLAFAPSGPFSRVDGRRHAVAEAAVNWNDPYGDWQLVLMEDLTRSVPLAVPLAVGGAVGVLLLVLGGLLLRVLRDQYRQFIASRRLDAYAEQQKRNAARKAAMAAVGMELQQTQSVAALAAVFLGKMHALFGAVQGVVYVADGETPEVLRLAAGYACAETPPATLVAGQGLLGQCVRDGRGQLIDTGIGDGIWRLRSGLGGSVPDVLMLSPLVIGSEVLGVIELAFLARPDADTHDAVGEMFKLLALNIEIHRRSERTEEMLRQANAAERNSAEQARFHEVLIDSLPYPVFYLGPDTAFLGVNLAFEAAFGQRREHLFGRRMADGAFLPVAEREALQADSERIIVGGGSAQRELTLPFADGLPHDVLCFISGFAGEGGAAGGLVGALIDISEQKAAERQIDRLADIERFYRLAQGREARILELKREVNELAVAAGRAAPYTTSLVETSGDHAMDDHPDYRTQAGPAALPSLAELIDLDRLSGLFAAFCDAVGIASAIIDLSGKVLVAARWQRACTDFHRANADSCRRCVESDTELASRLDQGAQFTLYRCKNGMTDAAAPIVVEGRHVANVFVGQFHVGKPDLDAFARQAQAFGYPVADYLQAICEAPVLDEQRLPMVLNFLSGFAELIGTLSLARRRADTAQAQLAEQAAMLRQERLAAMSLAEDNLLARKNLEEGATQ